MTTADKDISFVSLELIEFWKWPSMPWMWGCNSRIQVKSERRTCHINTRSVMWRSFNRMHGSMNYNRNNNVLVACWLSQVSGEMMFHMSLCVFCLWKACCVRLRWTNAALLHVRMKESVWMKWITSHVAVQMDSQVSTSPLPHPFTWI